MGGASAGPEGRGEQEDDLGGGDSHPNALTNTGAAKVAAHIAFENIHEFNFDRIEARQLRRDADAGGRSRGFGSVGEKDFWSFDNGGPIGEQESVSAEDFRVGIGGEAERGQTFGRDGIGEVAKQRSPPGVRSHVADEFTDLGGARLEFERGESLGGEDIANTGKDGAIPGKSKAIGGKHAQIHRMRRELKRRKLFRGEDGANVTGQRAPQGRVEALVREKAERRLKHALLRFS